MPKIDLSLPINGSKPLDTATNSALCGGKLQTALRLYSLQSPAPRDKSSLILLLAVSRLVVRFLFPYWQRSLLWPSVLALAVITTWLSWRCTTLARILQSRSPYLPKKSRTSLTKYLLGILNKRNILRNQAAVVAYAWDINRKEPDKFQFPHTFHH